MQSVADNRDLPHLQSWLLEFSTREISIDENVFDRNNIINLLHYDGTQLKNVLLLPDCLTARCIYIYIT